MPSETTPIAGRIDSRDYAFLMEMNVGGSTTLSEKLRMALSFYRKFHEGTRRVPEALEVLDALVGQGRRSIVAAEMEEGVRSELVHACLDHLPALLALVAAQTGVESNETPRQELRQLEERLFVQALPFVEAFLRLALTSRAPCYNPSLLKGRLDGIQEVAAHLLK